jgi:hypothetical protein
LGLRLEWLGFGINRVGSRVEWLGFGFNSMGSRVEWSGFGINSMGSRVEWSGFGIDRVGSRLEGVRVKTSELKGKGVGSPKNKIAPKILLRGPCD